MNKTIILLIYLLQELRRSDALGMRDSMKFLIELYTDAKVIGGGVNTDVTEIALEIEVKDIDNTLVIIKALIESTSIGENYKIIEK